MVKERLLFFAAPPAACFLLLVLSQTCTAEGTQHCAPSACGNIPNISYPFRLLTDPLNCGDYGLSCEHNFTVLYLNGGKYYVQSIDYDNFTIRLADAGVDQANCSTFPKFPLGYYPDYEPYPLRKRTSRYASEELSQSTILLKCANPVVHSDLYVDTAPCIINNEENSSHFYYVNIGGMNASDLMVSCSIEMMSRVADLKDNKNNNMSFLEIHREMAYGFEVSWFSINCRNCPSKGCYLDSESHIQCIPSGFLDILFMIRMASLVIMTYLAMLILARNICGTPCVIAFLIFKWRRRHLSGYSTIEEFLQNHNNLFPIRYAYSDIRKMTGGLKEKLGEGGFGSVYKGKLRSGQFAAIKMLSSSKANGQDFINEVATIGRIHHANVVQLIGFCVEGSKRALLYEFMANGSLDNHIFSREGSISLSWEKLHEISLGVARGIEYLHQGCDMQILHFDIKPHNILLDENFTPKISDFGLAKLYPTKGSIATLTAARGTIGYMAPELFYKNIGRVSYKADVYSYGMLLLEMVGKRKSLNPLADNLSEIYYPFWVHGQLSKGKLAIEDVTEEENEIARKMIITGLWCIQMHPSNRPPMNKVVEMLEGDLKSLQLPPRPVLYPTESVTKDEEDSSTLSLPS